MYPVALRRRASRAIAASAALTIAVGLWPALAAPPDDSRTIVPRSASVTLTEGTNVAASAAPDGSTVIDLHGMLYRVPPGGGQAARLTSVVQETARPDVGPDGRIAFQSYRGGQYHVWVADADGGNARAITSGLYDEREPQWSPDGKHIAFSSDRSGSYDIWSIEVATGALTQWTNGATEEFEPSWTPDGHALVHIETNRVVKTTADGTTTQLVATPASRAVIRSPAMAPDGKRVAYVENESTRSDLMVDGKAITQGVDVFGFTPDWTGADELRFAGDGGIRTVAIATGVVGRIDFSATVELTGKKYQKKEHDFDDQETRTVNGVLTPQLSPDGKRVLFVALNDLWLMPIGGEPRALTHNDYQEVDPVWSADGKRIAYASDRAGTEDLYVRRVKKSGTKVGKAKRVTALPGAEVGPAFSPDGRQMAFQDQTGATYVLDLGTSEVKALVPSLFGPGRPTWSADGKTIAFSAVKQFSKRFREGTSQILAVDVATGRQQFHTPGGQFASISTRGDDGPVWSPDGRSMAFVVDSRLRVAPVAADGSLNGGVRTVNKDVVDAPSWSGNSKKLLYLSNGELRLANVRTGKTRTIEVPLEYDVARAEGVRVIHAGALWNGVSKKLRKDVDITIDGTRIVSIRKHSNGQHTGRVIDASGLTVMPGLMDSHVHQGYQSRFFGDRQGRLSLSYGITSTLSVGDQVYRAMEDRDALAAGERVGPRFYATGEPIDGNRVYYNFMRPTTSDSQVKRELSRAKALDYDLLKTYVRLPANRMRKVIAFAHKRLGVPSESHYLSPGALVGQDGTSHLAATQRLGFARTLTTTGRSYSDVAAIYGKGSRVVTSTLFTTAFFTRDEIASDRRLNLMPPWKRDQLLAEVATHTADPSDPGCLTAECREAQTLLRIQKAGGHVLVGTDSPIDYVASGVHANLQEMVGYGWTPYDALRAATVTPARYLGIADDVGTLAPGKVADLIAVKGNPLTDIETAARVRLTMVGGTPYRQGQLLKPFRKSASTRAAIEDEAVGADPATKVTSRVEPSVTRKYWWHDPAWVSAQYAHSCDAYETPWLGDDHGHEH